MTQSFDFDTEETHKSNLLIQAALLRDMGDMEQSSTNFAAAAEIEERLAQRAEAQNDAAKAMRLWYSAASAWAYAGDFHHALTLLHTLEARPDTPTVLRARVQAFSQTVRQQRKHWQEMLRELASA